MNKPLKIAVVVGKFPMVSETFITNQIGFLKGAGHNVDILCLGQKNTNVVPNEIINKYNLMNDAYLFSWRALMPLNKFRRLLKVLAILIKSVGIKIFFKLLKALNPIKYRSTAINCNQFFRIYYKYYFLIQNYDVVHIHFADNAVYLFKQLKYFNKKVIVTFHGYDAHKFDKLFYKPILQLHAIQYTVNTQYTKQQVINLGFPEHKITILPVGLNTSFFKPIKKEHSSFNILFIGRLIDFKAPLLAIKIIERLIGKKHFNIHLHIIGEGKEYARCKQYAIDKNLSDYITLLGNKSQQEIKDVMNIADVFLFPGIIDEKGRCENQGLVVQEAQAMKLPVIISDVGGIQEGIINNKTGFVVEENDIDGFVEKLEFLINHPNVKEKMGEAGRAFVVENYDSTVLGRRLLNLYFQKTL